MLQATTLFAIFALFTGSVSAIYSNNTAAVTTTLAPSYSLEAHETTVSYSDETTTYFATSTVYSTHWFTLNTATITNTASSSSSASGSTASASAHETTSTVTKAASSSSASGSAATASTQETTSTVTKAASSSASGSAASASVHETTSTITSTLLVTLHDTTVLAPSSSAAASIADDGSNNKGANIKSLDQTSTFSNGCVPITQFVTVTKEPVTQYVTVTPNMTTQYVTVTGSFSAATVSTGNVQWFNTTTVTNSAH